MRDGKLWVALSTPGGHTITQTSAQMVINLIDFDMDIQAAISAPRIAFNVPDHLEVEASIPAETQRAPREMGHKVRTRSLGNAHGLMIEYDEQGKPVRFLGGTDPRGTGQAEGY